MSKEKTSTKRATRYRNFVSIGYPESMPDNWQTILSDSHIPAVVSPLHDKDKTPEGEEKKPHYHIMLLYDGVKTIEQAQDLFNSIGCIQCQVVKSVRGEARYECHLDNPEKFQYDIKDVKTFSGADYQELISLASDKYGAIREILNFIEEYDVRSFSDLLLWTSRNKEDWFRALCDNSAYVIKEHIASRQYSIEHNLNSDTSTWDDTAYKNRSGKEVKNDK